MEGSDYCSININIKVPAKLHARRFSPEHSNAHACAVHTLFLSGCAWARGTKVKSFGSGDNGVVGGQNHESKLPTCYKIDIQSGQGSPISVHSYPACMPPARLRRET